MPKLPPEQSEPTILDKLFALLQTLLPHHLLSQLMHWLARLEWRPLVQLMVKGVVKIYKVDLRSAIEPNPRHYSSFNAFFTRALKPEARPVSQDEDTVVSPVDGTVSQAGEITDGQIFQAKGHHYDLQDLLGGDATLAEAFDDGAFATLYLSPRDYHRIHMPLAGKLEKMIHVPGRLFSVSPSTTRTIPGLFARNERVVNLFQTEQGPMAVIMVGAIFVASMDTVWAGTVAPLNQRISSWDYGVAGSPHKPVELSKGDEMGRFNMGSTVILLFANGKVEWDQHLLPGATLQMGEPIGKLQ